MSVNKVYVLPPNEDWICDRFVKEWNEDNADISVMQPQQANVIWLFSDWVWSNLYRTGQLRGKKVITTIHHIVPEKFGTVEESEFKSRDLVTDIYHVCNKKTEAFIKQLTRKPIKMINYWANNKIWKPTLERNINVVPAIKPTKQYVP